METSVESVADNRMPRIGLLIALVAIVGFVTWSNWDRDNPAGDGGVRTDDPVPENPRAHDFVGSRTCAECHPKIAADFLQHPMAGTLRPIGPTDLAGPHQDQFTAGGKTYQVERRDGEVIHHEVMHDDDGGVLYDQAESVQYVIGHGAKGHSYLLKRGELFFQSPITWYSQADDWGLSPGYPPAEHYRFQRRVGDTCLSCHSGRPARVEGHDRFVSEKPFHELSIGCERCHGPGGRHSELFRSKTSREVTDSLIVNPDSLDGQRQDDICNQCHLEGKMRVLRRGHEFADFRPGELLGKTWTVYVDETPFDAEGRPLFTSHVEQMHSSQCFQKSEKGIRCTTCHDPHRSPPAAEKASFYNARCNSCHQDRRCSLPEPDQKRAPASGSCIACHMPKLHSRDVAHTTQADHRIVRKASKTKPIESLEKEAIGQLWRPFGEMGKLLTEEERRRSDAMAGLRQANDTGDIRLLGRVRNQFERILAKDPTDFEVRARLGYAWFRTGNMVVAKRELERALEDRPNSEYYLTFLGLIAYSTRDDAGLRHFQRLLKLNPQDGRAHGPLAEMLEATGELDEAIRLAERGLQRDPTVLDLRRALVRFYRKVGRDAEAREQERIFGQLHKRLKPTGRR